MSYVKDVFNRAVAYLRDLDAREPVVVNTAVAGAVTAALVAAGVTVSAPVVLTVVAAAIPVVLGVKRARAKVKPVK